MDAVCMSGIRQLTVSIRCQILPWTRSAGRCQPLRPTASVPDRAIGSGRLLSDNIAPAIRSGDVGVVRVFAAESGTCDNNHRHQ